MSPASAWHGDMRCFSRSCNRKSLKSRFRLPHRPSCPAARSARSSPSHRSAKVHGPAIGCVVDGCPPGMALTEADIQPELDRRKPGTSRHVTQRREADTVEILSGVFEGTTTGTPIALLIRNEDARSKDYAKIADTFRPGHADYTYLAEVRHARLPRRRPPVGARDRRARRGGRDREANGCASSHGDRRFAATCRSSARIAIPFEAWEHVDDNPFFVADAGRSSRELERSWIGCASRAIRAARGSRQSRSGVPVGWGEPVYGKLDADLAHAMMGINAVKGVEIGAGFARVAQRGTEHSDEMTPQGFVGEQRRRHPRRHLDRPGRRRARSRSSRRRRSGSTRHSIDKAAGRRRSRRTAVTIRASAFARRRSPRRCWRWC